MANLSNVWTLELSVIETAEDSMTVRLTAEKIRPSASFNISISKIKWNYKISTDSDWTYADTDGTTHTGTSTFTVDRLREGLIPGRTYNVKAEITYTGVGSGTVTVTASGTTQEGSGELALTPGKNSIIAAVSGLKAPLSSRDGRRISWYIGSSTTPYKRITVWGEDITNQQTASISGLKSDTDYSITAVVDYIKGTTVYSSVKTMSASTRTLEESEALPEAFINRIEQVPTTNKVRVYWTSPDHITNMAYEIAVKPVNGSYQVITTVKEPPEEDGYTEIIIPGLVNSRYTFKITSLPPGTQVLRIPAKTDVGTAGVSLTNSSNAATDTDSNTYATLSNAQNYTSYVSLDGHDLSLIPANVNIHSARWKVKAKASKANTGYVRLEYNSSSPGSSPYLTPLTSTVYIPTEVTVLELPLDGINFETVLSYGTGYTGVWFVFRPYTSANKIYVYGTEIEITYSKSFSDDTADSNEVNADLWVTFEWDSIRDRGDVFDLDDAEWNRLRQWMTSKLTVKGIDPAEHSIAAAYENYPVDNEQFNQAAAAISTYYNIYTLADEGESIRLFYGMCYTLPDESDKVVVCDEYDELTVGDIIVVKFSYGKTGTGQITMDVNDTGETSVYRNDTTGYYTGTWAVDAKLVFIVNEDGNWSYCPDLEDIGVTAIPFSTFFGEKHDGDVIKASDLILLRDGANEDNLVYLPEE